jgi:Polyketide cyclase / dehydrase and lipid transport
MSTWTATTVVDARPQEILDLLTDPDAAARWSPVPFEVDDLEGARLAPGEHARLTGSLAGLRVGFDLEVHEADHERLSLSAYGPIGMDVLYELWPEGEGSEVHASVTVHPGRGLTGRMLARATDALLGAGALRTAVGRLAHEVQPADGIPSLCIA